MGFGLWVLVYGFRLCRFMGF